MIFCLVIKNIYNENQKLNQLSIRGYQAGQKGGWMTIVRDQEEIISEEISQTELNIGVPNE